MSLIKDNIKGYSSCNKYFNEEYHESDSDSNSSATESSSTAFSTDEFDNDKEKSTLKSVMVN